MGTRKSWGRWGVVVSSVAGAVGCASSAPAGAGGAVKPTSAYVLSTPNFTIAAGTERYICYTKTLEEDVVVDRFDYEAHPVLHHVFFSRSLSNDPEGLSECDVVYRPTWLPLFVNGAGSTSLEYPAGAASILRKGSQVVLQLHVLNAGTTAVTDHAELSMRRSTLTHPDPVGIYAFGTQNIMLPPKSESDVVNECAPSADVETFATFAHMHQMGTRLRFEIAGPDGAYAEAYREDPFNFHRQHIDLRTLKIPAGAKTRVTCSYDNTTPDVVTFGESSRDEMCFFVGFVRGKEGADGCTGAARSDGGAAAPACAPKANGAGIGAPCSRGGGECAAGLSCSLDQSGASGPGFCLRIGGCVSSADCGGGDATCCAPAEGGGAINICIPESCRPSTCAVKK